VQLELPTVEWIDWYNASRLHSEIGDIPPGICGSPSLFRSPSGLTGHPLRASNRFGSTTSSDRTTRRMPGAKGDVVREHRYSFEMPHSAARIWALFQDYDRWTDYAPMVLRVDVLYPGDEQHNGRLRRVIYKMPFGRRGSALELVTDVEPEQGYTYTMISSTAGNDQVGHVHLEPLGSNRTMLQFDERYNLEKAPFKWFEGPIYKFINENNEDSMRRASAWLTAHPEYRPDLVDA
jgi:hypothetical protein